MTDRERDFVADLQTVCHTHGVRLKNAGDRWEESWVFEGDDIWVYMDEVAVEMESPTVDRGAVIAVAVAKAMGGLSKTSKKRISRAEKYTREWNSVGQGVIMRGKPGTNISEATWGIVWRNGEPHLRDYGRSLKNGKGMHLYEALQVLHHAAMRRTDERLRKVVYGKER